MSESKLDTVNKFMVGVNGGGIVIMLPPQPMQIISKRDALVLTAWLVALADSNNEFDTIMNEVLCK